MERPGAQDDIWENRLEGETRVRDYLAGHFDDRWTLICGYKNRKGEIDQVLVGPAGIFACEVKKTGVSSRAAGTGAHGRATNTTIMAT